MTSDESEDDHRDENLSILREALQHFALGIDAPSDSDEDEGNEEHLTDEEQGDESLEDEEQERLEHLPDEDRSAGLAVLRETLFALAQHYTSDESGESQDEGDKDGPAP